MESSLLKMSDPLYDVNVPTVMHVELSLSSHAKIYVIHLTLGWRWAMSMYCHHCSFSSQHVGFVRSTQYGSKEQSEADTVLFLHPFAGQ